ncbi:ABC transporter permease [Streptomyces sp. NPDC091377]|uniref:ABC transporter permease n=1 Tax=Streptomyces sp. NPDC091377 TaxID=3365995 RepID=UPI0038115217
MIAESVAEIPKGNGGAENISSRRRRVAAAGLPLLGLASIVALWWLVTFLFRVEKFLLPSPLDVFNSFAENSQLLLEQTVVTLLECVEGFLLAIAVAVPTALIIVRSRIIERIIYPLLLALNAVPKIAIAPILVVWMGFGSMPKVVMAFLLSLFPIVISTASGMKSTPVELVELLQSLGGTKWQEFAKIRIPYALPQIFVGLKVAISLAVIGAVIAEFVNSTAGLGYVIMQSGANADTALAFAAMVPLAVMSIVLFYAVAALESKMLPWAKSANSTA